MYRRGNTLFEHQQLACQVLGFQSMSEHQRRYLVRFLRAELEHTSDRDRLVLFARRWLHEHRLIIVHDRKLRKMVARAVRQFELALAASIRASLGEELLERWRASLTSEHESRLSVQTWLWAAPTRHSTRSIEQVLERIELLYALDVHNRLADVPIAQLRRYAKGWRSERRRQAPASRSRAARPKSRASCATACSPPPTI
jgi:hypothetical protein